MEATGVYWKPVWNVLEEDFHLWLINPRQVKQVPGRKTDVKDCEWIAELLQYGLLPKSFVPSLRIRQLRTATRNRTCLSQDRTTLINRIHKVLEEANIKLATVASNIMGVSGRQMLRALVLGQDNPDRLAELATGRLRKKIPQLRQALNGRVTAEHRFDLRSLLSRIDQAEQEIASHDERIARLFQPYQHLLDLLATSPGVDRRTSECLLAEIGPDMAQFPSASHLASWAGLCPGNHRSAGKSATGKTTHGSRWLKRALGEAAWAAARTKNTYLAAKYRRLAPRRGRQRAIVALAHSILVAAYHILKHRTPYHDLGPHHFDHLNKGRLTRYHVRRLQNLGYNVTLTEVA